jgi:hypothetical protein
MTHAAIASYIARDRIERLIAEVPPRIEAPAESVRRASTRRRRARILGLPLPLPRRALRT